LLKYPFLNPYKHCATRSCGSKISFHEVLVKNDAVTIDINADLGESEDAFEIDLELMRYVSSANVACGGHAGDHESMRRTLLAARDLGVAVGSHPSFPDRANFGRVELPMAPDELQLSVQQQIAVLVDVAKSLDMRLVHVKPHGALYHAANRRQEVSQALGRGVQAIDPQLLMIGQASSPCLETWRSMGLRCAGEAFADRAYEPDGSLRKRTLPGALIEHPEHAARQALKIVTRRMVVATDGSELPIEARTICIHSDTPGAVAIAREVHKAIRAAGIRVASFCSAGRHTTQQTIHPL
jgi:UPF0271 protein